MPAPVVVRLAVAGMSEVNAALDGVAARVRKMNQQVENDSKKATAARVKNTRQGVDQELKEVEKWVARSKAADDKRTADAAKASSKRAADSAKAAATALKADVRAWNSAVKEMRRAEQEKTNIQKQEEAKRLELVNQNLAKQEQIRRSRGRAISGAVGRAGRSTLGSVTGVVGGIGLAAGGMMIHQALSENIQLQQQAALLVNATRDKKGKATQTTGGLTKEAQALAGQYGIGAGDIMKSMSIVSARAGGAEGLTKYRQDMEDIIKTAKVYGVTMEDMGGVVAAALKADVQPGEEMRQLIQDIAAMGKDGAIEIEALAQELAKLGGVGKGTELSKGAMLRRMVGMAQIAADAAVSPEESRTSMKDMVRDLNTAATSSDLEKRMKGRGVAMYGKTGLLNDPGALMPEAIDIAMKQGITIHGKHLTGAKALNKMFTGTSLAIVNSLLPDYAKGGKEGVQARIDAASGATLAKGERNAGLAEIMRTPATQLAKNMEQFKAKIGEMIPEFTALLPRILEATQAFAKLAVWATNNPFKAVSALFIAHLTKELGAAKISDLIRNAFMRGGGGGLPIPGGVPVPGVATGATGKVAGVASMAVRGGVIGALAVVGGYVAGQAINDQLSDPEEEGARLHKVKGMAQASLSYYRDKEARGTLTDEDKERLLEYAAKAKKWEAEAGVMEQEPSAWNLPGRLAHKAYMEGGGENAKAESFAILGKALMDLAESTRTANSEMGKFKASDLSNPGSGPRTGNPPNFLGWSP